MPETNDPKMKLTLDNIEKMGYVQGGTIGKATKYVDGVAHKIYSTHSHLGIGGKGHFYQFLNPKTATEIESAWKDYPEALEGIKKDATDALAASGFQVANPAKQAFHQRVVDAAIKHNDSYEKMLEKASWFGIDAETVKKHYIAGINRANAENGHGPVQLDAEGFVEKFFTPREAALQEYVIQKETIDKPPQVLEESPFEIGEDKIYHSGTRQAVTEGDLLKFQARPSNKPPKGPDEKSQVIEFPLPKEVANDFAALGHNNWMHIARHGVWGDLGDSEADEARANDIYTHLMTHQNPDWGMLESLHGFDPTNEKSPHYKTDNLISKLVDNHMDSWNDMCDKHKINAKTLPKALKHYMSGFDASVHGVGPDGQYQIHHFWHKDAIR